MDLLTFGTVIVFESRQYVWLASDAEERKIHLAQILDMDKTKTLRMLDEKNAKTKKYPSDSPMFAYVVLTTDDFGGRAAFLMNSDTYTDRTDGCDIQGVLNAEDIKSLKKRILSGLGLPQKLVILIRKLDGNS